MPIKISLNDIIVEDVTLKDFDANFRNNLENVQSFIDQNEDVLLDTIGGISSLIEDFQFVRTEDIEKEHTKKSSEIDLKAKIRELEAKLLKCSSCEHGVEYKTKECIYCFGDGTEVIKLCPTCEGGTFHRNNKCLQCTENPPKPFSKFKEDILILLAHIKDPTIDISSIKKLYSTP